MLRYTLLTLFISFLCLYAWKDWYKALCMLVVLTAILERPDMPRSMFNVPGLNPWNIAFAFVILAWLFRKGIENIKWDMPKNITFLLVCYLVVIIVSYIRLMGDYSGLIEYNIIRGFQPPTTTSLFSDLIINTIKWMVPGLLLFHGCNSKQRLRFAVISIVVTYTLIALQVIKWMPLGSIVGGEGLADRSLRVLDRQIGYHRVDLSMILAGASWAIFSSRLMFKDKKYSMVFTMLAGVSLFAQALTGGRTGYGAWVVIGLALSWWRWKKLLLLIPVVVAIVAFALPSVTERLSEGFSPEEEERSTPQIEYLNKSDQDIDYYTVTAGRLLAWPYVIEKIADSPFLGYGREAMQSTGISTFIFEEYRDLFPHPHNAYLQLLLDNGIIGSLPIFIFFYLVLRYSVRLFKDDSNDIYMAVGGLCLSTVIAQLVASIGAQSFYPKIGVIGMWCTIGLMLRVYVERMKCLEIEKTKDAGKDLSWVNEQEKIRK